MKNVGLVFGIITYMGAIGAAFIFALAQVFDVAAFSMTVAIWIRLTHKELFE